MRALRVRLEQAQNTQGDSPKRLHQTRFQRRFSPVDTHQEGHLRHKDKGEDQWEEREVHLAALSAIAPGFVKDVCVEVAWDRDRVYLEEAVCELVFWESYQEEYGTNTDVEGFREKCAFAIGDLEQRWYLSEARFKTDIETNHPNKNSLAEQCQRPGFGRHGPEGHRTELFEKPHKVPNKALITNTIFHLFLSINYYNSTSIQTQPPSNTIADKIEMI